MIGAKYSGLCGSVIYDFEGQPPSLGIWEGNIIFIPKNWLKMSIKLRKSRINEVVWVYRRDLRKIYPQIPIFSGYKSNFRRYYTQKRDINHVLGFKRVINDVLLGIRAMGGIRYPKCNRETFEV